MIPVQVPPAAPHAPPAVPTVPVAPPPVSICAIPAPQYTPPVQVFHPPPDPALPSAPPPTPTVQARDIDEDENKVEKTIMPRHIILPTTPQSSQPQHLRHTAHILGQY
jgi:hypothetical protein